MNGGAGLNPELSANPESLARPSQGSRRGRNKPHARHPSAIDLLFETYRRPVWLQASRVKSCFTGQRGSLYIRQSE
jgi:hypothetical protein